MTEGAAPQEIRIVLVDDHVLVRDGIQQIVSGLPNMRVLGAAGSAPEALTMIRVLKPTLVLADFAIGEQDALWLLAETAKLDDPPPIVVLTMHSDGETVLACLEAGARGFLPKSCQKQDLCQALEEVARGGTYVHPLLALATLKRAKQKYIKDSEDHELLAPREKEVLLLTVSGLGNQEMATRLNLSLSTVKTHLRSIFRKLNATDRTQAVVQAVRRGLILPADLSDIDFEG